MRRDEVVMDIEAALEELRSIAAEHVDESRSDHADTGRMAELVLAIDGWLSRGGSLPDAWCVRRPAVVDAPQEGFDQRRIGQNPPVPCPGVGRELQMSRVGEGMCRYCNAVLATSNGLAPPHDKAWTGVDERRG